MGQYYSSNLLFEIAVCGHFWRRKFELTVNGACERVKKESTKLVFLMSAGSRHVLAGTFVRENITENMADSRNCPKI